MRNVKLNGEIECYYPLLGLCQ